MNLSGSSSSLTSDVSSKAGTVSLRSYGIGGAVLHKRILLITRQHSREGSRERANQTEEKEEEGSEMENENVDRMQGKTAEGQGGLCSSKQRRGRSRQPNNQGAQADSRLIPQGVRAGRTGVHAVHPTVHAGSPPRLPGSGPRTLSPLSQPHLRCPKPPESPIRTRLMSPFRILRERSQSRGRPMAVSPQLNDGEVSGGGVPSPLQDNRQGQEGQRARRAASPNPFLWLCRDRHTRRKTV